MGGGQRERREREESKEERGEGEREEREREERERGEEERKKGREERRRVRGGIVEGKREPCTCTCISNRCGCDGGGPKTCKFTTAPLSRTNLENLKLTPNFFLIRSISSPVSPSGGMPVICWEGSREEMINDPSSLYMVNVGLVHVQ